MSERINLTVRFAQWRNLFDDAPHLTRVHQ